MLQSILDALLGHGKLLNDRLDPVQCCEVKHVLVNPPRCNHRALDSQAVLNQRPWEFLLAHQATYGAYNVILTIRHAEVTTSHRNWMYRCIRGESRDDFRPIRLCGSGDKQAVQWSRCLDLFRVLCGDELVGTELHGFILLPIGSRQDDNSASHLCGELNSQVACQDDRQHGPLESCNERDSPRPPTPITPTVSVGFTP